ncbi:MAG: ArsC/Spx/MgsR family protein [Thiotrichales bacterium]
MDVIFYEKPGCAGNAKQKSLLKSLGHELEVRDLLAEPWSETSLRPYFGSMPVSNWFNLSAPLVKSGEIPVSKLDEQQALELMIAEPLLIRRPLLQVGDLKCAGFEPNDVLALLGVKLEPEVDLQSCPKEENYPVCGEQ